MRNKFTSLFLALVICPAFALAEWRSTEFNAMGTRAEVEVWATENLNIQALFSAVKEEVNRLEWLLSPYIETSDVSRINRNAGKPVSVSQDTYRIIEASLRYSQLSDGAFDISFASVGQYYDYRSERMPSQEQTKSLLQAINFKAIELDYRKDSEQSNAFFVSLHKPNMAIDLGGIAKGYTVDSVASLLASHGITSASISLGGDSYYLGDRGPVVSAQLKSESPNRLPWMIGIKNPRLDDGDSESKKTDAEYVLRVPLVQTAFSTSGDYERFFISEAGERVHHIINPKAGKSAGKLMSVSIVGPNSMDCDALSTTVFVLGAEKGLALIESMDEYDAIVIDRQGKVYYSSGFKE